MPKHRAIIGGGPLVVRTTGTGFSTWYRFGPFLGNTLSYQTVFSGVSSAGQKARVQGTMTTASTNGAVDLASRPSTSKTSVKSTIALNFAFVRFRSSVIGTGKTCDHMLIYCP